MPCAWLRAVRRSLRSVAASTAFERSGVAVAPTLERAALRGYLVVEPMNEDLNAAASVEASSPETLALLVAGHAKFLAFLERRVRDRDVAEELLQQAFVRAAERGHTLRAQDSATAWFYRLLRNAIVDHQRRRGSEQRAVEAAAREPTDVDDELFDTVCQCVRVLLGTLKPEYAEMVRRVDLEGVSVAELAREKGLSPNNAGVRLHRARKALHRQLVASCGTCATHGCRDCTCKPTTPATLPTESP